MQNDLGRTAGASDVQRHRRGLVSLLCWTSPQTRSFWRPHEDRDHPPRPPAALVTVQPAKSPPPSLQRPPPAPALEEGRQEELPGPAFLPPPPPAGSAKDAFTCYSSAYPDFVEAVRFHRAFEEAQEKSLQPGQEGQALVGFGDFKFETLQSLYESEDPKKIRFVNYLRRKAPAPGTQMENAVRYVRSRDRQRAAAASTTSTTTASVSAASQGARSASQCVFYFKAVEEPGGPF
ncbi:bromodomain-containing protein 4-like [Siniperca chuatsi]|uniref:bromodomain-containing protein 4-like n=1 Tax=Siniperca chuatsi TaxID=119488 RepID=UPI001CE118FE|nr:bromodomain-containing protein 4-like [Siniperca chuatsi]